MSYFVPDDWKPAPQARDDIKKLVELQQDHWARMREMYAEAGRPAPIEVSFYEYSYEKLRVLIATLEKSLPRRQPQREREDESQYG